jgi:hypothetical protein
MVVKMIKPLFLGFAIVFGISACYYDKGDELYGNTQCVTTNMTYTKDISVIVNQSCVNCHGSSMPSAGISLHDYATVVENVKNGKFVGSVKQDGTASNMPKGGGKWSNCNISKLDAWIQGGYKQ